MCSKAPLPFAGSARHLHKAAARPCGWPARSGIERRSYASVAQFVAFSYPCNLPGLDQPCLLRLAKNGDLVSLLEDGVVDCAITGEDTYAEKMLAINAKHLVASPSQTAFDEKPPRASTVCGRAR